MTQTIIEKVRAFRNELYQKFKCRCDATMQLIDATAGQNNKESIVQLSLSSLFERSYSSITDVLSNFFCKKPDTAPNREELKKQQSELSHLILRHSVDVSKTLIVKLAVDCTANGRIHSKKLTDRGFVHTPNKIPGQKPITVGHQYSTVVLLTEKTGSSAAWVTPLSVERVTSEEKGAAVGMQQIQEILKIPELSQALVISVGDTAYSETEYLLQIEENPNHVHLARVRSNRIFYYPPKGDQKNRGKGRPKIYGEKFALDNPGEATENIEVKKISKKGKELCLKIERYENLLAKVCNGKSKVQPIAFDAVRVTVCTAEGIALYKKPLWIMTTGKRRKEVSLEQIAETYFSRFDIEHYFRFCKQKLLLTGIQTPETRHEENWQWICLLAYQMLYMCRNLAEEIRHPWEKARAKKKESTEKSPSQVHRDFERIILEIGTPAKSSKPRGKSPGRLKGAIVCKREDQPIVKKSKKKKKTAQKLAA